MTMSDPIADMLTRIRNANTAKHDTVDIPASKMKIAIASILADEGYIAKYDIIEENNFKTIRVTLKYGADKNEKLFPGSKEFQNPDFAFMPEKKRFLMCLADWALQSFPQIRELLQISRPESFMLAAKFSHLYGRPKAI